MRQSEQIRKAILDDIADMLKTTGLYQDTNYIVSIVKYVLKKYAFTERSVISKKNKSNYKRYKEANSNYNKEKWDKYNTPEKREARNIRNRQKTVKNNLNKISELYLEQLKFIKPYPLLSPKEHAMILDCAKLNRLVEINRIADKLKQSDFLNEEEIKSIKLMIKEAKIIIRFVRKKLPFMFSVDPII